ncbi:MAG: hypothetical protein IK144_12080 [Bacteroidaceae bacterium]|nr:hypothetical protein [Bacteroidaceae bacterium]
MEHDVYYERQRALIERSLQAEREREAFEASMKNYRHEVAARKAYFRLQGTKRSKIVRSGKTTVQWKSTHATYSKGERPTMRTRRFPNSHITVYYKAKPC